ncbi:MAG: peptidylprolyl isomerase [Chloroflexota bacterium]
MIEADKSYQATIVTEKGDVVIDLFSDTAPTNVNSFVYLAQNGWYDNVTFHRVLDGFMAQAGDPSGSGMGWPGYRCGDEVSPERTFDQAGMVAMANSGPNTNGGQFFITYGPTPHLNSGFTIIGQVVSGQEVADSLTRRDPQANPTFTGDEIITITVAEQ